MKEYTLSEGLEQLLLGIENGTYKTEKLTLGHGELDSKLNGGLAKGTLNVLASRPGIGKTAWLLDAASKVSRKKEHVLYITLEKTIEQVLEKINGKVNLECMHIHEEPTLTPTKLENILLRFYREHNCDPSLIIIDYVDIMVTEDMENIISEEAYGKISTALRKIATARNLTLLLGKRLKRQLERRDDKRPVLSDLREAEKLVNDVSTVMALYNGYFYHQKAEDLHLKERSE